ncbi:MAG: ATP-binding protein [Pirellulales bacterium]
MEINIISGKQDKPKCVVLHGEAGVGKTTLAARLGKSLIIPTEDGSDHLDVDRLPLCKSYSDVVESIKWVYDSRKAGSIDHDTVVLDSIDWAENFVEADLVREVFDQSYGKGNVEIGQRMGRLLNGLALLNGLGMTVVVIAHSECKTVEMAEGGSFSRWQPKLSKRSNARLQEWSDAIGYCSVEVMVTKESTGFSERGVGKSTGRRIVSFNPSASYVAKCRTDKKVSAKYDMSDIDKIKEVL